MTEKLSAPSAELLGATVSALFVAQRDHLVAQGMSLPQLRVLIAIRDRGPLRVTELAAALQVTQPTMTAQVQRLEAQGWLARTADGTDGRAVRLSLTATGRSLLARSVASRAALLDSGLQRLDPHDADLIAAALPALDRLAQLLGNDPAPAQRHLAGTTTGGTDR